MQEIIEKSKFEKEGYSVSVKGFVTILEPKNVTKQTSGIISFGRKKVDIHKEIGDMVESRVLRKVS